MAKTATKTTGAARAKNASKTTSAARRTPTGPRAGQARSNQTAVLTNPDRIKSVTSARGGGGVFVEAEGGKSVMIAEWQLDRFTSGTSKNGLAVVGKSFKALTDHLATIPKPGAKLARGVDSHNSPHSAKAVSDNRRNESTSAGRKARGDAAKVAGKSAKAERKASGTRGLAKAPVKITGLVKVKDAGLAVGSGREAKLAFALKCKTTADFLGKTVTDAAGKEHKCDAGALSGMVKRGHVRLG